MNKIVKTTGTLSRLRQVYARAGEVFVMWDKGIGELATFEAVLPQAQAVLEDLQADQEPAPNTRIANHMTIVAGCFSNGPASGEIFARTMMEYVADMQPSIGDLEYACDGMIRYRKSPFQPTISDVLDALQAAKKHREDIIRQLTDIINTDRTTLIQAAQRERIRAATHP